MAQFESAGTVLDSLAQSSPVLAEAAGLLAQTSLIKGGLSTTDAGGGGRARQDDVLNASRITDHVNIVSNAAPDVALAAPDFAVATA